MMKIRTVNEEYRELFGRAVYKVSLSAGMTCPNRDGTLGNGGCAFCTGSGEFAEPPAPLDAQIRRAAERVRKKLPAGKDPADVRFIAYFQDHTNTYAPAETLKELFGTAVSHPLVCGLAVGTRPDCVHEENVRLLSDLNRRKPVWVELGLQTVHEETARSFGRGYPLAVYEETARRLREEGIRVVTHLILGLPGETEEMMLDSVRYLRGRTDGVKFHMLHVLEGTAYAELYRAGLLSTYALPEYRDILTACLRVLPPEITVHRITGDGDKKTLIAPKWSGNKKHVMNYLLNHFRNTGLCQGEDLTFPEEEPIIPGIRRAPRPVRGRV